MSDGTVRAHVVGSLLPAPALGEGEADTAVDEAIALQTGLGFPLVTDGEQRRGFFFEPLMAAVEGIGPTAPPPVPWHGDDPGDDFDEELPVAVVSRLTPTGAAPSVEEARYAAAKASALKVTLSSPFFFCQLWSPTASAAVYPDPLELFRDAASALRAQIEGLDQLGVAEIQIDADELGVLVDPFVRARYAAAGLDPDRLLEEGVDVLNQLVAGVSCRTSLHLCRGNFRGLWMAAGDWEPVAARIFPRLSAYDALLLEFDGPRCGSFVSLRHVPDDKQVVLGLVSSKRAPREDAAAVAGRIRAASRYLPLERLGVSTAAGFAPAPEGNPLDAAAQERALRLVVEAADLVWG